MALGFLRRMFGGGGDAPTPAGPVTEYQGFTITPELLRKGGQFVTAALIAHEGEGGRREHRMVRADTHASQDEAQRFSVLKAQRLIDEQGMRLFD